MKLIILAGNRMYINEENPNFYRIDTGPPDQFVGAVVYYKDSLLNVALSLCDLVDPEKLKEGKKIPLIKLLRDLKGLDLAVAKHHIDLAIEVILNKIPTS